MGTWGMGAFDNDDAADWLLDLTEADDASAVAEALETAVDKSGDDYLEAPEGVLAIAAAELVAAAVGNAAPDLPDEARPWLAQHGADVAELGPRALAAIRRTLAPRSELRELWSPEEDADPDDVAEWERRVANLEARLVAAAP